jgi:uncharacterized protein
MKPKVSLVAACGALGVLLIAASIGTAGDLTTILPNGMLVTKSVKSLRELRYQNVVHQQYDLSCGAAALATILKYFYDDDVDESEIIRYMLEHGNREQIAQKGFSLLDLKRYAEHRHYLAAGYKEVPLNNLRQLKIPSIVLFNTGKYTHFVVLKGIRGDRVFLSDPSYGNRSIGFEEFENEWNKVLFVVASQKGEEGSSLPMQTGLSAPEMDVFRMQNLGVTGFSTLQTRGEF